MPRTTITLSPEADLLVKKAMRERGVTFKEAVNAAIIGGLALGSREAEPYVLPTFDLGAARVDLDKALQLAGELDDDEFLRKHELGK